MSPTFTSSKMKLMFPLIKECAEEFVKHFQNQKKPVVTIDSRDAFTRYTNDVIASSAFGVKVNSFENPKNEFFLMGADFTNITGLRMLKFVLPPKLKKVHKTLITSF